MDFIHASGVSNSRTSLMERNARSCDASALWVSLPDLTVPPLPGLSRSLSLKYTRPGGHQIAPKYLLRNWVPTISAQKRRSATRNETPFRASSKYIRSLTVWWILSRLPLDSPTFRSSRSGLHEVSIQAARQLYVLVRSLMPPFFMTTWNAFAVLWVLPNITIEMYWVAYMYRI